MSNFFCHNRDGNEAVNGSFIKACASATVSASAAGCEMVHL